YRDYAHYYNKYLLDNIKRPVPVISFWKGSSVFAATMAEANPDVVAIDWNADIKYVKQMRRKGIAIQGNIDPFVMYADKQVITDKILQLFERMRGEDGFIFNLGHGIMPDIPFDNVKHAINLVKEFRY